MTSSVFWDSIRSHSGWGWGLGEIGRRPSVLDERGPRFAESPLHWAMLSHLEASTRLCEQAPLLLSALDSQGRTPMDWAIEKVFFLKERQEGELSQERGRTDAMAEQARSCLWFALSWCEAQEVVGWAGSTERWLQWALAAGELDLSLRGEDVAAGPIGLSIWLCGLSGLWASQREVERYVQSLSDRQLMVDSVVFGRPLGLHVAHLWSEGRISAERAAWFHRAGLRLDQETDEESVELFCGRQGEAGALRWDAMAKKLDL